METKDTVLYGILGLMIVGMAFLFYSNYQLGALVRGASEDGRFATNNNKDDSSSEKYSGLVVGAGTNDAAMTGVVQAVSADSLTFKKENGTTVTVRVSGNTRIMQQGTVKSAEQYEKELAAYNAHIQELLKDPEKNKEALAALKLPTPANIINIKISDLRVGDKVLVATDSSDKATEKTAISVFRS